MYLFVLTIFLNTLTVGISKNVFARSQKIYTILNLVFFLSLSVIYHDVFVFFKYEKY